MLLSVVLAALAAAQAPAAEIHDAAKKGDIALVRQLLEGDVALIDARDTEGRTALGVAAQNGRLEVLLYVLNKAADPNSRDRSGDTPLCYATRWRL